MNETNPYQPLVTSTEEDASPAELNSKSPVDGGFLFRWAGLVLANSILPGLFASSLVRGSAWIGVVVGVVTFIIGGWWVGSRSASVRKGLIRGGAIVAITQLFPIGQILAGGLAVGLAESIGLASMNDDQFGSHIDSVAGGLFCTLLTGFLLMCPAAFFGAG
ncbi:MAG: hypothetical protein AAF802_29830, partial [Planctomycetota bacterium]